MDITTLSLKILGAYMVISGLFLIFKGKSVPHLLRDFFDHPAIVYLTGVILVFLSATYLIQYNIWTGFAQTVMTVIAWLVFVKGLLYIFAPKVLDTMVVRKLRVGFAIYGIVAVIVGGYLFFYVS